MNFICTPSLEICDILSLFQWVLSCELLSWRKVFNGLTTKMVGGGGGIRLKNF